ncbi:MAG: hypothetical protein A2498_16290 [Lentisphaerae bacterium RIFOXYC12_FULL_60_16]|nr:MAG: hypothetical protein A2498_16290 [Lentisphaerae bacterium RIFOXYC12_FULL_60_16]OGV75764.1 MAG: hypothetical protein A2340_09670 [Lentisphaerae bacterium RIFOXYB12_FULL_60_10]
MNPTPSNTPAQPDHHTPAVSRMACDDIQEVLFDYMTRELGGNRADLVREHLRKCDSCQAAAADIQRTLDLLHRARATDIHMAPAHLSEHHHQRLIRAVLHPILDWINRHHILVSILAALALVALVGIFLTTRNLWQHQTEEIVPVTVTPASVDPAPGDNTP